MITRIIVIISLIMMMLSFTRILNEINFKLDKMRSDIISDQDTRIRESVQKAFDDLLAPKEPPTEKQRPYQAL